jgi:hypothetical protein
VAAGFEGITEFNICDRRSGRELFKFAGLNSKSLIESLDFYPEVEKRSGFIS